MAGDSSKELIQSKEEEATEESLSAEDMKALDRFCSSFEVDELTFEDFCLAHEDLDVRLDILVPQETLVTGGTRQIAYTRVVESKSSKGLEMTKERLLFEISFPPNSSYGDVIVVVEKGDRNSDGIFGNLQVTLKPI